MGATFLIYGYFILSGELMGEKLSFDLGPRKVSFEKMGDK